MNYNSPPWLCIKKGHLLPSLIVLGKAKPLNLQVYLAPLLHKLHMLWNGIEVVDNSRSKESKHFKLRAILMWIMHEYPGYGDLASLSTSGYYACPTCGMSLTSRPFADLRKVVYKGHQNFFDRPRNVHDAKPHVWRAKDWFEHWEKRDWIGTKTSSTKTLNYFHNLPYWHDLLINHLLNPMHIIMNVSQIIWDHLNGNHDIIGYR